jgi:hypothetical protein
MARVSFSAIAVVATAVVLTAAISTGLTYAATSSGSGVKACANSKHNLGLLTKAGKCPTGYHATTIGAIGPRGPRGPAGKKGAPGPAVLPHAYTASVVGGSDFPPAVVSLRHLPAGAYQFSFQVTAESTGPTTGLGITCSASAGSQVVASSGDVDVTDAADVTGIGVANIPANQTVHVSCDASSDLENGGATIVAVLVGTIG